MVDYKKILLWVVGILTNALLSICAFNINKVNGTLESLNNSFIELKEDCRGLKESVGFTKERVDAHDKKFEKWEDNLRSFYETYDLKRK